MKEFNTLQNLWNNQKETKQPNSKEIANKAEQRSLEIKRFHNWTMIVLTTVFVVLLTYFLLIGFYELNSFSIGLGLMGIVLLSRVGIELKSKKRFNAIKPYQPFTTYSEELLLFYKWRKKIHYLFTPILYSIYTVGFLMLLPTLKDNLSKGFYWYVFISGIIILIVIAIFILKQIKKELETITFLQQMHTSQ